MATDNTAKSHVRFSHGRRRIRRSVLIAAIVFIISGLLVAQAAGVNIFGAVARWTAETFLFESSTGNNSIQPPIASNAQLDYSSLSEAIAANHITEKIVPNWWPDGFYLTELKASVMPTKTTIYSLYKNGEKSFSFTIQVFKAMEDISSVTFEKDGEDVEKYVKDGIDYYIMSNLDSKRVTWINNRLLCSISGNLSVNELKEMVDSIYEGK
jgi:hypothetical protein